MAYDMASPSGLEEIAEYADAIGGDMRLLFSPEGVPSGLVDRAHDAGLEVHAWTVRKENAFLPPMLRRGDAESGTGDLAGLFNLLRSQKVDAVFTDDPGLVIAARAELE